MDHPTNFTTGVADCVVEDKNILVDERDEVERHNVEAHDLSLVLRPDEEDGTVENDTGNGQ